VGRAVNYTHKRGIVAHEIMGFVHRPDYAMLSLYSLSIPNQPLHQTPKSMALVNFLLWGPLITAINLIF
jgi:hypothetical protein